MEIIRPGRTDFTDHADQVEWLHGGRRFFCWCQKLMNEIKSVVKENWDFEHKQKYKDEIELRRALIEAARAVGVAYGNGQQPTTTNLMWLR